MENIYIQKEKGQVIVYLAIGLVIFLGFVALAIDGGMALADRRNSQNVADAASLSGGGAAAYHIEQMLDPVAGECSITWNCDADVDARNLAEFYAIERAENNDLPASLVTAQCGSIDYGPYTDKFIDVTVEVTSTTQSNFLQLIYPKALVNFVDAVTRVHPRQPIGFGMAVIALNDSPCGGNNGVKVNGGPYAYVDGGGIFSNGCINGNGTPGDVVVVDGGIAGHYLDPGGTDWDPDPELTDLTLEPADWEVPPPTCTKWEPKWPDPMNPGLYCFNKPITVGNNDITGIGVTIYTTNKITFNATGCPIDPDDPTSCNNPGNTIHLEALPANSAPVNGAIPGVLLYVVDGGNVVIAANGNDVFKGLIYAPQSLVTMTGTANPEFTGQIIGWDVRIGGDDTFHINYDGCNSNTRASWLELNK